MTESKHKAKSLSQAKVKRSFNAEPRLEAMQVVRKMLLADDQVQKSLAFSLLAIRARMKRTYNPLA